MRNAERIPWLRRICGFSVAAMATIAAAQAQQDSHQINLKVDAAAAAAYDFGPLRQRLQAAIDQDEVPCASMLVIAGDKVVFKEAFGWADIENKKPMATDTICHLASSTKWVTAAVIMTVVDEGKMSLDDPVGKFFPELKDIPVKDSDQTRESDHSPVLFPNLGNSATGRPAIHSQAGH